MIVHRWKGAVALQAYPQACGRDIVFIIREGHVMYSRIPKLPASLGEMCEQWVLCADVEPGGRPRVTASDGLPQC